jgi:hypothetical protein
MAFCLATIITIVLFVVYHQLDNRNERKIIAIFNRTFPSPSEERERATMALKSMTSWCCLASILAKILHIEPDAPSKALTDENADNHETDSDSLTEETDNTPEAGTENQ